MHLAAEKGHMEGLEKLLEFKSDIEVKDKVRNAFSLLDLKCNIAK